MPGKEVQAWADEAMFKAEEQPTDGPRVYLLHCNNDPLGSIAAAAKAYKGEFVDSLSQVTDDERRYYLTEVQKSVLAMPLEAVNFHFRITGVTRGFTHQMVRQRTAAYSQESTRFAVKETVPVGRPPSLEGTVSWDEWWDQCGAQLFNGKGWNATLDELVSEYAEEQASKAQLWRRKWDGLMHNVETVYNELVNDGMPAEDARGALPTNLLTQLNYFTNLRNYKEEAGKRLCTQAQFEWRTVFAEMVKAIRAYGMGQQYERPAIREDEPIDINPNGIARAHSAWQFDALADLFRPICYYRGKCQFEADFDRACSIRERVNGFADLGIPSVKWGDPHVGEATFGPRTESGIPSSASMPVIPAIHPAEWLLDPAAAR
jgi:flavin-dependent thymidylate synthase